MNFGRRGFVADVVLVSVFASVIAFLTGGFLGFIIVWVIAFFLIDKSVKYESVSIHTIKNQIRNGNYKLHFVYNGSVKYDLSKDELIMFDAILWYVHNQKNLMKKEITPYTYSYAFGELSYLKTTLRMDITDEHAILYRLIFPKEKLSNDQFVEQGYPKHKIIYKFM